MKGRSLSLLLCFLTALSASAAEVATDWPTYMNDPTRSGVTGQELSRELPLDWVFTPTLPPSLPSQRDDSS